MEQRLQHQGQHADEHVNPYSLVGPVVLRPERDVPGILEVAEGALDMVLGAVAMDNLVIGQVAAVGGIRLLPSSVSRRRSQALRSKRQLSLGMLRSALSMRFGTASSCAGP